MADTFPRRREEGAKNESKLRALLHLSLIVYARLIALPDFLSNDIVLNCARMDLDI